MRFKNDMSNESIFFYLYSLYTQYRKSTHGCIEISLETMTIDDPDELRLLFDYFRMLKSKRVIFLRTFRRHLKNDQIALKQQILKKRETKT